MNEPESEAYVSTYDPNCIEVHSDTSDFDLQDNRNIKIAKSPRCRGRKHKEIRLLKHKSLSSHSSLYFDVINSVDLENLKKTNLRNKDIDYNYLNFCKQGKLRNSCICIDDDSIENSGVSQNNRIEKFVIRGESKSAEQYFVYDTNILDTKSYIVTNKTPNSSFSSGNYYINSENKQGDNKITRPDIYYRIDSNCVDHNNRFKSKRIDRYLNRESICIENHSPNNRKLMDNIIRRRDNRADHYIHCEDNKIQNFYNRTESNLADNHNKSVRPDDHSCDENIWPDERKFNSPVSLGANRAQANERIKEKKKKKNKIKRHDKDKKVYDDLQKELFHSSSSRWPLLKRKCMPRLCNILGRFGNNAVTQENTQEKCKRCSPLDDVTLLYCSKCKTTRTTANPMRVVQSIHTLNGNAQTRVPFDKMKYIQYGTARVLQAADVGKNLLQLRCSNCSFSSTSDSEMLNEKFRQKLEKRFRKKIKKYFNRHIRKGSIKEKIRQDPYQDMNYASMDVKTSPCSTSSHFLDSIFRDINQKYEDKQTEFIGDSNRKHPNLNTLNARVGGSDHIDEIVGHCCSNYQLTSNLRTNQDFGSSSGTNKRQQIKPPVRAEPVPGFGCHCNDKRGDKGCVPSAPNSRPLQPCRNYINNPPVPIRPTPHRNVGNPKVACGCKTEQNPKLPPQCHCLPSSNCPGAVPKIAVQESCERCCQQTHEKILQSVHKQYNGEILCIHNPPCVLINGCLNLPPSIVRNQHTTAVYSATQGSQIPCKLLRNKSAKPGLGNMKINNICEKCVKNRTSYYKPRGQMSNNVRRTTQGMNTYTPYLFDTPLQETSKYQPKLNKGPEIVPKILETQSIQVEMSTNEMKTEYNTKVQPDKLDIVMNVNHPTAPPGDVNTTTQVRYRYSTFCHNACGTQCHYKSDYITPQLSQGRNSELPICLMNYSDFPLIKENASTQMTPEADPILENYCVHVPICKKLRNCKVEPENIDELPTTLTYKSQTSNMNLISLAVKEAVSVQTTGDHSTKSINIYVPAKKMLKCVSDKSSCKKTPQNQRLKIPQREKHLVALTAVKDISTQVRDRKRDPNFRHQLNRQVLATGDIACQQVHGTQRQLTCRHHPRCLLIHQCVGKELIDSIIPCEDIPECSHKRCCELVHACLARSIKDVKAVSSQYPPNTCHII